jgi:hypothetical protein
MPAQHCSMRSPPARTFVPRFPRPIIGLRCGPCRKGGVRPPEVREIDEQIVVGFQAVP